MGVPSKIMIVAMPWANPEVPSIQLGVLKKYLVDRGLSAEARHWYLDVGLELGFDAYTAISTPDVNGAETVYSCLLFPEMRETLLRHKGVLSRLRKVEKAMKKSTDAPSIRFRWDDGFFSEFEALHQRILDRYRWEDYALVGFTLNYGQTVASLYMAREIKKRNPACKIIFGGAEASGELGASLVSNFPQLDFACNGEGELPLYRLAKAILGDAPEAEIRAIKGIVCRGGEGRIVVNSPQQLQSLDELETPDYDEYFEALKVRGIDPQSIIRELPIEASRGCPFSCNFCSLNLQWENFRSRSPEKVAVDIRKLSQKYFVLGFRFMDNILPKDSERIFEKIAEQRVNYRFFYEIRAQTPPRVLRLMKKAGATMIQCGVEAFSTALLKKFNKKSKFINNLQVMKLCEELDIDAGNNLITDFPFSTEEDVAETLRNMEFCLAYQPANISVYALGVGSPDYDNAGVRGLKAVENASIYRFIYPEDLFGKLSLIAKDFKSPGPKANWRPVVKSVERWRRQYASGKRRLMSGRKYLLSYFDGGTFVQIEDYRGRDDGASTQYLLDGIQRDVYLFAEEIRPWHAFREAFDVEDSELKELLDYFVEHKLMFEEDGHYLSLAMNSDLRRADERMVLRVESREAERLTAIG